MNKNLPLGMRWMAAKAMDNLICWLVGCCEDQMVRAWLINERNWLRTNEYSSIPDMHSNWPKEEQEK